MRPSDEAAEILTRILESMARRMGATLKPSTRADIQRACELLTSAGYEALDDLAKPEYIEPPNAVPEEVRRWKEGRR